MKGWADKAMTIDLDEEEMVALLGHILDSKHADMDQRLIDKLETALEGPPPCQCAECRWLRDREKA